MTGNWWFPWDIFVVPQANGDLWYYAPDHVGLVYAWDAVNQVYLSPPGQFDVMSGSAGATWTRTTKDGIQWHFNSAGFLDWVRDRHGLQNTLTRDPQNRITMFTDYAGRFVNYNYNAQGYLGSLVDFNGRTTSFTYTAQGYLASITYPPATYFDRTTNATVTRGRTVSYGYITGTGTNLDGNLTSILDDRGNTLFSAQYDPQDRSTSQTSRGRTWTAQYGTFTRVTDPDGVTLDLYFNGNGSIVRKDIQTRTGLGLTPLRSGEPSAYTWLYSRNAPCGCDAITSITRPDGSVISFTYDGWGNVTSRTMTPATGSPETESWTFSGFAQFCRPLTSVTPRGNAPGATAADYTTTWTYNSTGDCISATFPKATVNGTLTAPAVSMTYNSTGQMTTFTDPSGTVTKYDYAAGSLALTQVTHDFGASGLNLATHFGRDLYARPTSVTDPRGNTTTITWNLDHELIDVLGPQPLAGEVKYLYDNNWALYSIDLENKDSTGTQYVANPWITTVFDYDANNRPTATHVEIDPTNVATTTLDYTAAGRLMRVTNPVGDKTEFTYDERGLIFTAVDGAGTSIAGTSRYDYDANGDLAAATNPRGYATTYANDGRGRPVLVTRADGCQDVVSWDLDGNNTRLDSTDSQGTLRQRTDRDYDPFGLSTAIRAYHVNAQGQTGAADTTSIVFDGGLRPISVTDATGATTTLGYDAIGRRVSTIAPTQDRIDWSYDEDGNVVQETHSDWNQATSSYDVLIFDQVLDILNRRITSTRRDSNTTMSSSASWGFDSRGNVVASTDELGNTRAFTYDARNHLISTTYDLRSGGTGQGTIVGTVVTQVVRDATGRVAQRVDGQNAATQYAYDSRGRITSITDPAAGVRSFGFDANGNATSIVDPNGTTIVATYDPVDRLTGRSITRGPGVIGTTAESIQYDTYGRPSTMQDDDTTVVWTYDDMSRIASETEGANPLSSTGVTFSYSYDNVGGLASTTYPDGTVEQVTRDGQGRISQVQIVGLGSIGAYQYAGARVLTCSRPNSVVDTTTFDPLRRATWEATTQGTNTLFQYQYVHDAADHRLLEKRHHASGTGDNYALDSLYRTACCKTGVSDPVLELQSPGSQTVQSTVTLSYNPVHGLTSRAVTTGGSTSTTNFSADSLQFYSSVGGTSCSRDANGNLVDDGTNLYDYDYRNQLCRVRLKSTGSTIATYDYDLFGRRTGKSAASVTLSYAWARTQMTMINDSSGLISRLHYGARRDEVLYACQRDVADLDGDGSTTDYVGLQPVYDGAFDCVGVLGPNGAVAESYVHAFDGGVAVFDSAGQQLAASNIGWYQGYGRMWRDDETGFLYGRLRYYVPATGRFLTQDPIGRWLDGAEIGNGYAWIGDEYRNAFDPLGLTRDQCPCDRKPYLTGYKRANPFDPGDWSLTDYLLITRMVKVAIAAAANAAAERTYAALEKNAHDAGWAVLTFPDAAAFKGFTDEAADDDPCFGGSLIVTHGAGGVAWLTDSIPFTPADFGDPKKNKLDVLMLIVCQAGLDAGWAAQTNSDATTYSSTDNVSTSQGEDAANNTAQGGSNPMHSPR